MKGLDDGLKWLEDATKAVEKAMNPDVIWRRLNATDIRRAGRSNREKRAEYEVKD